MKTYFEDKPKAPPPELKFPVLLKWTGSGYIEDVAEFAVLFTSECEGTVVHSIGPTAVRPPLGKTWPLGYHASDWCSAHRPSWKRVGVRLVLENA